MSFIDLFSFKEYSEASTASWRLVGRIVVELGPIKGVDDKGAEYEYKYTEWEDRVFVADTRQSGDGGSSGQVSLAELD